jgi:methionyl-tRNA formyltransferase
MNIGYFADGPWSHNAFEKINNDSRFNILFIVPRKDTNDSNLKYFCDTYEIDYLPNQTINSESFLDLLNDYDCDILVSMSFDQIFKKKILNATKHGVINCHAGMLPYYRGRNVLNWVLINDESEFGITVHHVDEGIDTGDIIIQKTFPISEDDNYNSLLKIAFNECASMLHKSLILIKNKQYKRIPQSDINELGFYCGKRIDGDEQINWNDNSRDIHNLIRAVCKPGPEAYFYFENKKYRVSKSRFYKKAISYKGIPGQVLFKKDNFLVVKTKDSFLDILIEDFKSIKIGDRLL